MNFLLCKSQCVPIHSLGLENFHGMTLISVYFFRLLVYVHPFFGLIFFLLGKIRPVCGLVSIYLYEFKEFVIYPCYGLKFHLSRMIRPYCGLFQLVDFIYYPSTFMDFEFHPFRMIRLACGLYLLSIHFYGL